MFARFPALDAGYRVPRTASNAGYRVPRTAWGRGPDRGKPSKMSVLRLNIDSGMRRRSSCMLHSPWTLMRIKPGDTPLSSLVVGKWPMLSMHELSLSMSEAMLSSSMLILS